jgi:hypothetical protein
MATKIKLGKGNWGVKENGLLAYNDEDNVFKAIEMDFSRSSTATRESSTGLITDSPIDTPRIDFSDSSDGALLLEPESTNLLTYSEALSNWTNIQNATVTDNVIVSPDGNQTASRINETTDNAVHRIFLNPTVANAQHSFSVFMKAGTRDWCYLRLDSQSSDRAWFNIKDGVIGTVDSDLTASIEDYGNGWFRCTVVSQGVTFDTTPLGIIAITTGDNVQSYVGDVNEYIYAWGAQLEQQSYATSYIPTSGATATRIAETCSKTGLENYINSSEGVLYVEMSSLSDDGSARIISISDGTNNNRIHLFFFVDSNKIYANYRSGGVTRSTAEFTLINILELNKFAYKWKSGDFALWVNGAEVATDSNTTMIPIGVLDKLAFEQGSGGNEFYGKVKDLRVYDTALSDEELQNLTTL